MTTSAISKPCRRLACAYAPKYVEHSETVYATTTISAHKPMLSEYLPNSKYATGRAATRNAAKNTTSVCSAFRHFVIRIAKQMRPITNILRLKEIYEIDCTCAIYVEWK